MQENQLYTALGANIASRRRALGLTQAQLSDTVGLSRASLANIERGNQKVLLHHVYRLAEALSFSEISHLLPAVRTNRVLSDDQPATVFTGVESLTDAQRKQIESLIAGTGQADQRARR
ncbi:MAG: helix-turn-helix transcriptional regulator [Pseudolabrys sp.]|nr:helix-turn-helix transcriptional regulator [Pseudolabrys sp.]